MMKIAIYGGTGLVGSRLASELRSRGDEVFVMTRGETAGAHRLKWPSNEVALNKIEGADAIVNLTGAAIGVRRWSKKRKHLLRSSRVGATELISEDLAQLASAPNLYIGASGVGYYGDRGDDEVTETDARGQGFLAELAHDWEEAHRLTAEKLGARLVLLRIAPVLTTQGGALQEMMKPFRMGVGGPLGSGRQWSPWISLNDTVGAIIALLDSPTASGAYNLNSPGLVRNKGLVQALGAAMSKACWLTTPRFALRLALGEMAELVLSSTKAQPRHLLELGYRFRDPELDEFLVQELHLIAH